MLPMGPTARWGREGRVCFTRNRDQVGADTGRRWGPLSAARTRNKNSLPFRYRTTAKPVTDLPIEA
jgi:hypothetical protein